MSSPKKKEQQDKQDKPARSSRWGVLLLAHGAPEDAEDVPEFLLNVRAGRPLPPPVVEEITQRYTLIGGSPLLKWTQAQARAMGKRLGRPVIFGMRNWKPFIADAVAEVAERGLERLVVICLAPQNSQTSTGLYRKRLDEALAASEEIGETLSVDFVESWHDSPGLIEAFAEKVRAGLAKAEEDAGAEVPVILTAHSVPEKTIKAGDPYADQVQETARLVAEAASVGTWSVAFQSKGMTADPWIGPTVEARIDELAAEGARHIFIAPIGFVCDHVEILFDVDVLFRGHAAELGVTVSRSESLNDSELLIGALAELAESRMKGPAPA